MSGSAPLVFAVLMGLAAPSLRADAQEPAPKAAPSAEAAEPSDRERREPPVPVRMDLVVTRQKGDRVASRVPYSVLLGVGRAVDASSSNVEVKLGIEVPAPSAHGAGAIPSPITYRNVGLTLSGRATLSGPGRYALTLSLQTTGIYPGPGEGGAAGADDALLNTLNLRLTPLLRDGEKTQVASVTNPLTGEVTTIDVTLRSVK
jgi:hypothetical protein